MSLVVAVVVVDPPLYDFVWIVVVVARIVTIAASFVVPAVIDVANWQFPFGFCFVPVGW